MKHKQVREIYLDSLNEDRIQRKAEQSANRLVPNDISSMLKESIREDICQKESRPRHRHKGPRL